jgi:DNA-binding beta-propeller fold protein YncE
MRPLAASAVLVAAAASFGSGPGSAEPVAKAYVLDSGAHTLVALELPGGRRVGSLALTGTPWALVQSPDGRHLVVLDRGPGEDKHERGYRATGKSSATVVDPATLTAVGRVELGAGLAAGHSYFSPDGHRLTLLCPGYEAKNPAEGLVRELVTIDLVEGREVGRLALEAGAWPIALGRDGLSLPLIQGLPRDAKFPYPQSRLFVVDLGGPRLRATLDMGGWTHFYTDGVRFYLLDPGKPDKNPQKNKNGTVQVASLERDALVGSFDAGRDPRGLYPDEVGGQVFIPGDGPPGASAGELRVVRGDSVAARLAVAANPKLLVREGDSVYVVGEKAVTLVDPVGLQVKATIPLARGSDGLVGDDDLPTEFKVSPDGKRAFAHYGLAHKVAVLDLEAMTAIGSTKTGSGGKKLFGNMMGGMFGMVGLLAAGYSPWIYTEPNMLAVRPDGAFAYAVNTQTKDVTVVDGATGKSRGTIGGGGYALELLNGGKFLCEVSGSELRLVDLERNVRAAEVPLNDLRGLFFPKDRSVAVALAKGAVLVLDGTTGKELARHPDFVSPDAIVFEGAAPGP